MTDADYTRCKVKGSGEIYTGNTQKGMHFDIIEMSASDMQVFSKDELEANSNVRIKIHLPSFLFQVDIRVVGRIEDKIRVRNGFQYKISFIALPEKDMKEIDELLKNAC